tara:strand:+ start:1921 stop:2106 length:186 start_codon:yes stop_codon:yes gene_type:complete
MRKKELGDFLPVELLNWSLTAKLTREQSIKTFYNVSLPPMAKGMSDRLGKKILIWLNSPPI